jgi:hypothetical protein
MELHFISIVIMYYLCRNQSYEANFKSFQCNHRKFNTRFNLINNNQDSTSLITKSGFRNAILVNIFASLILLSNPANADLLSPPKIQATPPAVVDIIKDRIYQLRSGMTGEKVGQLRVGDSLFSRLRGIDKELDNLQEDIYRDSIDWEVVEVYPKIFRAFSPLFTAYTDRAFPTDKPVDNALRYALRYEVGGFYNGVKDLEDGILSRNQRRTQQAFARMSLSYDRYLKAGDLFVEYDKDQKENTDKSTYAYSDGNYDAMSRTKLSYVAPSIEAPGLEDDIVLVKGPDKGRKGQVLWISKGENIDTANVVVKFLPGDSGHSEVKLYPYSIVAKTTPPDVQFEDDIVAAYISSAISSGIMYPLDSFKTRQQTGLKGIPDWKEGGVFRLWKGVLYFIADPNDAVYVAAYGLIRPALLAPINVENTAAVFWVSVFAGSIGDAFGSIFRVPMEIIYKQIQTGAASGGWNVVSTLSKSKGVVRLLVLSWVAVLCRDMPFAGLQIALFDVFKSLLSFLDDYGVNIYLQRALWGALAGSAAAWITTPFDVLTTNVITAAQDEGGPRGGVVINDEDNTSENATPQTELVISSPTDTIVPITPSSDTSTSVQQEIIYALKEVGPLFSQTMTDIFTGGGGLNGLFQGAVARILYFGPAAMIFFASYETIFDLLTLAKSGHAFWQR